jgi:hypothetical protein
MVARVRVPIAQDDRALCQPLAGEHVPGSGVAGVDVGDDRTVGVQQARVLGPAAGGLGPREQLLGILAPQRSRAVDARLCEPACDRRSGVGDLLPGNQSKPATRAFKIVG